MGDVTVTFLGSGDAFASGGRFHTCFLVEAPGTKFLIDCGASAPVAMKRHGVDSDAIDAVIVSHLHGDHFGGIPFVVLDAQYVTGRRAPLVVAGPAGVAERVTAATDVLYPGVNEELRFAIEFIDLGASVPTRVGDAVVIPEVAAHGGGPVALSLRVECAGKVIAYSGDTGWTNGLARVAAGADLFICESSLYDGELEGHLSYETLARRRSEFDCKQMILTHMGPAVLARLDELEIESASDGLRVTV